MESIKKENHIPVVFSRRVVDNLENDLEYRMTDYSKTDLIKNLFGIDAVVHLAAKRGSQGKIAEFHDNEILKHKI